MTDKSLKTTENHGFTVRVAELVLTSLPIGASFCGVQAIGLFAYSSAASQICRRIEPTWLRLSDADLDALFGIP